MTYTVLSLCDRTGAAVRPWAEAGHHCLCIDTQHSIRRDRVEAVGTGSITYRWGDARSYRPESYAGLVMVYAWPPCTHLAVSGARDWKRKGLGLLIDALQIVEGCRAVCETAEHFGARWMIENPVGRLATAWRKSDYSFDPCDYAMQADDPAEEAYTKRTHLWAGGGFAMPETTPVVPVLGSKMHHVPPGPDRANIRSATPTGFARAVYAANQTALAGGKA